MSHSYVLVVKHFFGPFVAARISVIMAKFKPHSMTTSSTRFELWIFGAQNNCASRTRKKKGNEMLIYKIQALILSIQQQPKPDTSKDTNTHYLCTFLCNKMQKHNQSHDDNENIIKMEKGKKKNPKTDQKKRKTTKSPRSANVSDCTVSARDRRTP